MNVSEVLGGMGSVATSAVPHQDDDRLAIVLRGLDYRGEMLFLGDSSERVLALGQVSQAVLHDDDGSIDDEAKIERTETH
jgi:hypothetical protein